MPITSILLFFFFQAEDGIRDVAVTGVQTCALPISCTYNITRRAAASGSPKLARRRACAGGGGGRSAAAGGAGWRVLCQVSCAARLSPSANHAHGGTKARARASRFTGCAGENRTGPPRSRARL